MGTVVRYAAVHLAIAVGGDGPEINAGLGSAGHEQNCDRGNGGESDMHLEG